MFMHGNHTKTKKASQYRWNLTTLAEKCIVIKFRLRNLIRSQRIIYNTFLPGTFFASLPADQVKNTKGVTPFTKIQSEKEKIIVSSSHKRKSNSLSAMWTRWTKVFVGKSGELGTRRPEMYKTIRKKIEELGTSCMGMKVSPGTNCENLRHCQLYRPDTQNFSSRSN